MMETTMEPEGKAEVEVAVTSCPECGTEWETVVTRRTSSSEVKAVVES